MGELSQISTTNDPSSNQLDEIRLKLKATNETLQKYNDIIISQADELKTLRGILCVSCKRKFLEASIRTSPRIGGSTSPKASDCKPFSRQTEKKTGSSSLKNTPIRPISRPSTVVGTIRTVLDASSNSSVASRSPSSVTSKSPRARTPTSSKLTPSHAPRIGTTNRISSNNSAQKNRDSEPVIDRSQSKASTLPDIRVRTSRVTSLPSKGISLPSKATSLPSKATSLPSKATSPPSKLPRSGTSKSSSTAPPSLTRSPDTNSSTPQSDPVSFALISPSEPSETDSDNSDSEPPLSFTHSLNPHASTSPPDILPFPLNDSPSEPLDTNDDDCEPESPWSVMHSPNAKEELDVTFERSFPHNNDRVNCVKFSMDGRYMAVGLSGGESNKWKGQAIIYSTETGIQRCRLVEYGNGEKRSGVDTVCFSPNGEWLAIGHKDGHISLWLIDTKRVRNMFRRGDLLSVISLDFSPDGRTVVSGSWDGRISIWNVRDGSLKQTLVTAGYTDLRVTFCPTGRYVAAGSGDGVLFILDSRTQKLVKGWEGHQNDVSSLAFIPNNNGLLSGSFDGTVKHWDVTSLGDVQSTLRRNTARNYVTLIRQFGGHPHHIRSIATSADGRWVLCGLDDSSARIWNISNGMPECSLFGHTRRIWSVDTSPVGNYLAMGDIDGRVSLWRMK